jgi:hypothetical protein
MKKLIIFGLSVVMVMHVSAQFHRGYSYGRPRVSIGIGGYFPVYPYYGFGYSPFYGYPPFGYGYGPGYGNGYRSSRPTKLDLQIQEIYNDYNHQIWEVKHDKSVKRKERRKRVHELEHDRDKAIVQAKKAYYEKPPRRHNFNPNNN